MSARQGRQDYPSTGFRFDFSAAIFHQKIASYIWLRELIVSCFPSFPKYLLLVSFLTSCFSPFPCHFSLITWYFYVSFHFGLCRGFFFSSSTIIHLFNLDRWQRKEVVEERRVSESKRAPAPAGVNICFRNLNNGPPVICISDNGRPYGSVDPHWAEVLLLSPLPSCVAVAHFFH